MREIRMSGLTRGRGFLPPYSTEKLKSFSCKVIFENKGYQKTKNRSDSMAVQSIGPIFDGSERGRGQQVTKVKRSYDMQ